MSHSLFISYGHRDMSPIDWLDRLRVYLAPLRRHEIVDVWDDTRIEVGKEWRPQIEEAIDRASAAILLVGPGFLASDFIAEHELPPLLEAAQDRGVRIFPLIVGYCAYDRSELEKYQSFNDPKQPLEALSVPDQNKTLNDLSIAVDEAMRHSPGYAVEQVGVRRMSLKAAARAIAKKLGDTHVAFIAQCRRRNGLVNSITERLGFVNALEYEQFFFQYYKKMTDAEKFEFDQIRAITEGPLREGNRDILQTLEEYPELLDEVPELMALRQHLVFWLNKYDRVFAKTPEMCLLYAGVEDGVPFPDGIERTVRGWLARD
jgi:hypothetical protein